MSDYRIDIKVKNNNLLKKIEERGYSSVGDFCRQNNKMNWAGPIGEFVNLKRSPLNAKGEFLDIIHKICEMLLCSPEELFSEIQLTTALETNRRTVEVNEAEMQFLLQNDRQPLALDDGLHLERLPGKIDELLNTLTPRERKVISMNFGLGEYSHSHTHVEIAKAADVTPTRIRQIQQKALRKLRHPTRAEPVRDYK